MVQAMKSTVARRALIGFGPETPGWGSWDWVGSDLAEELSGSFRTLSFGWNGVPQCDVLFVVKHPLPAEFWERASDLVQVVYCPIDHYASLAEIDSDGWWLRRCARVLVHSETLVKYFARYARTEYIDHHVKFIAASPTPFRLTGPILWVGVHSNLPPVVEWVNRHDLPAELIVLTNVEVRSSPSEWGFDSNRNQIRIETWSRSRHIDLLNGCRAALDIKGDDFRSRHKPPAKAIDFIASGLPFAMNVESSSVQHLARMGFDVASPEDLDRWLSPEYFEETQKFGYALRELLSRARIGNRYRRIFSEVLS